MTRSLARRLGIDIPILVTAAAALSLGSCGQTPAADGYVFTRSEYEQTRPDIRFVVHPSQEALRAAAPPGTREDGRELMAWSVLSGGGESCEIHIVDPVS